MNTARIQFLEVDVGLARTKERAELMLEDMFALGEVSESERPEIQHRNGFFYIVTRYAVDSQGRYL
jgi:hypothetical protein